MTPFDSASEFLLTYLTNPNTSLGGDFVKFKNTQGFNVHVVSLDEEGFSSAEELKNYLINYDEQSTNLFNWYQQLVAESLGKKKKGILPIISVMPKDNHSVMQLYLDGFKNNFYTFFFVNEKNSTKININFDDNRMSYLKNKNLHQIKLSQKLATENVFNKKKIPFRSFTIFNRDEKTLGELFSFFILETILIGKMLKL